LEKLKVGGGEIGGRGAALEAFGSGTYSGDLEHIPWLFGLTAPDLPVFFFSTSH